MKTITYTIILTFMVSLSNPILAVVIEEMSTGTIGGYSQVYDPSSGNIMVLGKAEDYFLSDGTSWRSGAGSHATQYSKVDHFFIEGTVINYVFDMPIGSILFQNTDYNFGNHSAQGILTSVDNLTLTAEIGSSFASLSGQAMVASNDETWYGEPRFNYYAAEVGDIVSFSVTYALLGGAIWDQSTLDDRFSYHLNGIVDFTQTEPVPEQAGFSILLLPAVFFFLFRRYSLRVSS